MLLCLDDANINIVIWDTMAVIGLPVGVAGEEKILWENGLMLLAYDKDLNRNINRQANRELIIGSLKCCSQNLILES